MKYNKGFSLIEFLVVVALIGVMSIFLYTPRLSRWNMEASTAQSEIVSVLKYYQKKSMRDGFKYYINLNQNIAERVFEMEAFVDEDITSRQTNCTTSNDAGFPERRLFDSLENIQVISCQLNGAACTNTGAANTGICFYPNGSSSSINNRNELYISHSAGNNNDHATNAFKIVIWRTTSFFETSICKGTAIFTAMNTTTVPCNQNEWIEE